MESVREYLLGVTCASVFCGILCMLVDEKHSAGSLVKLLCGIFLSLTLLMPVAGNSIPELDLRQWEFTQEGKIAAEAGVEYARQAKMQLIKERTEAYIVDKARLYGLDLTVEVVVSGEETPAPEAAVIGGGASPYARTQLQQMMETELGIPKENQRWMESGSG